MLSHAEQVNGDLPGVSYAQADALDLPYEEQCFDAVVCQFGIMFFPDKAKGIAEMFRVLKPGGLIALSIWDDFSRNQTAELTFETISGFFEADPPGFMLVPFSMTGGELGSLYSDAGFDQIEATTCAESVVVDDLDRAEKAAASEGPRAAQNMTTSDHRRYTPGLVVTRKLSGRMQTGCVGGCFR